ncbi:MAG: bacillithiol biosynthesis BshC, partial [Pyrinomonadaceae bacterium]
MNQEPARASQENSLKLETVSFEKIPNQSRLFLDFQADLPAIAKFYPEKQTTPESFAEKVIENYKIERGELCDILRDINQSFGAKAKTFENIELLRQTDCVAVVTGQQAGLFSGALYTIYKALSAIRLCEDLRKQNIKAVPVFWIAEEDHDFDEIKKTFVLNKEGKLAEIENSPETRAENSPVGLINLDETINETSKNLFANLTNTQFTEDLTDLLSETYKPGESFSV